MGVENLLGFTIAIAVVIGLASLTWVSRIPPALKVLVLVALGFRVFGALLRYRVLADVYGGSGDAVGYLARGLVAAERFRALDLGPVLDSTQWYGTTWYGTNFITYPAALVSMVTGDSLLGGFVLFSLMGFVGLVGFIYAFHRIHPAVHTSRYARWIVVFPALWFWPSSMGKEALLLLGLGLVTLGFAGRRGRYGWASLTIGLFLVFAVRSEVAIVAAASIVFAQWTASSSGWSFGRVVQGVLILAAGAGVVSVASSSSGIDELNVQGVHEYVSTNKSREVGGGSAIRAPSASPAGIPMAVVNALFRPFPWEAGSFVMLFAAIEILAFWAIVWRRRHNLIEVIRAKRKDRLVVFAMTFCVLYAIPLGMMLGNLGLITRQRSLLFPFLFIILEADPYAGDRSWRTRAPTRRDVRDFVYSGSRDR